MTKAFVFGKFLPFHKGHEAMIRFALTKCDFLTVLICCSDKEHIPAKKRQNWIEKTFEGENNIEIKSYNYLEDELPNTSQSSLEVSNIWAEKFLSLFPHYDLVITSEDYGEYVATYMNIKHIEFDKSRQNFPISATSIRNDLSVNWSFLPNAVKSDFAIKVILLGTESTGKTTLAKKLVEYFDSSYVKEIGREIIVDSNSFQFEDLHRIASQHAKNIDEAVIGNSILTIIDTDINITKSYANFIFDKALIVENKINNSNKADLYLYLNNDVKYIQDGTRLDEKNRNLLDLSHRKILSQNNIEIVEIKGNWEQRFEKAVIAINKLVKSNVY